MNLIEVALANAISEKQKKGPYEISASQLATQVDAGYLEAEKVLESFVAKGALTKILHYRCPCDQGERLDSGSGETCPVCERTFGVDDLGEPTQVAFYKYDAPRSRDVRWMVALHGMNTLGPWQEEFMWRVSRTYGYSVPVAIYKYGNVKSGAILKFRQRQLVKELTEKIHQLSGDAHESGFPGKPDVIAHSLGTWMLGQALQNDSTLQVGRVILLGSILRPDFPWIDLINCGQVEAVMCHYSAKDFWAWVTHYGIPDSGPSGQIGFNDRRAVVHHGETSLGHSDYFLPDQMPEHFRELWTPFLTNATAQLYALADGTASPVWKESTWIFRATLLRLFLLSTAGTLLVFFFWALVAGTYTIFR